MRTATSLVITTWAQYFVVMRWARTTVRNNGTASCHPGGGSSLYVV